MAEIQNEITNEREFADLSSIKRDVDIVEKKLNEIADEVVDSIIADYGKGRDIDSMKAFEQPDQDAVIDIVRSLLIVLFPGYYRDSIYRTRNEVAKMNVVIEDVMYRLRKQIEIVMVYIPNFSNVGKEERKRCAKEFTIEYFRRIPKIREYLDTDLQATFDGDPAANNKDEIVLSYPGLLATAVYRLAHELVLLGIPMIPRMMSEYAHRETGVDIHPAAEIGKYFFIDHATGIVIGSTSIIGEHVKVYQGVTIGALSTSAGHALHGVKRHPTIEDNVTLYSGATVLGGNTVIGEGCVIGGNAFVTKSVAPHTRVSVATQEMRFENDGDDEAGGEEWI
ncbi:MAG: serine acetyltransferase [Eubacterium sp.]|nr:serine acetyltransferase [Eubacterium sp.]